MYARLLSLSILYKMEMYTFCRWYVFVSLEDSILQYFMSVHVFDLVTFGYDPCLRLSGSNILLRLYVQGPTARMWSDSVSSCGAEVSVKG